MKNTNRKLTKKFIPEGYSWDHEIKIRELMYQKIGMKKMISQQMYVSYFYDVVDVRLMYAIASWTSQKRLM